MVKPKRPQRQSHSFKEWFGQYMHPADQTIELERLMWSAREGIRKAKTAKQLRAEYNQHARLFNTAYRYEIVKPMADYILTQARFKGNEHVLSLGLGPGIIESFIARYRVPNGIVIGMDFAFNRNLEAKKLAEKSNAKNFHLITGDAERLPVKPDSQNIVLVISPERMHLPKVIKQSKRVIVKSADSKLIMITTATKKWLTAIKVLLQINGFELSQLKAIERKSGYFDVTLTAKLQHSKLTG